IALAMFAPAQAVAARKRCRSLCKGTLTACVASELEAECAGTSGHAARRCKGRLMRRIKNGCRHEIIPRCQDDPDRTRCLPPPVTTTTTTTVTTTTEQPPEIRCCLPG